MGIQFLISLQSTSNYFVRFLQLQLFLTLISLPIVLFWGLPLSLVSPLGNCIFAPFLTLFLLLSSIIFFCELVYIPNTLFIALLDYLSACWSWMISWAQHGWLLRCAQPPLIVAVCVPLGTFLIMHYKKYSKVTSSTFILLAYTFINIACLYTIVPSKGIMTIPCFQKELTLINTQSSHILIDTGALTHRISTSQWVTYTLVPQLIRYGIKELEVVITLKPSATAFKALTELVVKIPVKRLYVPYWKGSLSSKGWKAWENLLRVTHHYGTSLIALKEHCLLFSVNSAILSLIPEKHKTRKNKLSYRSITMAGLIDK